MLGYDTNVARGFAFLQISLFIYSFDWEGGATWLCRVAWVQQPSDELPKGSAGFPSNITQAAVV